MSFGHRPNDNLPEEDPDGRRIWPRAASRAAILAELVDEHRRQSPGNDDIGAFASMPSIEYVVEHAGMAENEQGKRYRRQHRLKRQDLKIATDKLRHHVALLKTCRSFSELHEIVGAIAETTNGLGPLYAYDTASRLAAYLGIAPDCVYLDAGARVGARALGLRYWQPLLPVSDFPAPLKSLAPDRIESFLRLYKDQLSRLSLGRAHGNGI